MNAEDIRKLIGQEEYLNRQFVSIYGLEDVLPACPTVRL
jgi:hypothetical protein